MPRAEQLLSLRRRSAGAARSPHVSLDERIGRELFVAWVHLAVLWTFAIAKPLFDVVADSPEFFVARGNTRGDILIFAFATALLPPTILIAVEALCSRVRPMRAGVHLGFVAVLASAFAVQLAEDAFGGSTAGLLAVAASVGVVAAAAYARTQLVPGVLTVLGPAPFAFLAIFLLFSPVSDLVRPEAGLEAKAADVASKTPVVLVVFDEFDPNVLMDARQRIDRTRYPNFAALADGSTWYRNATTVNTATTLAVPGLLSGRRPPVDSLPTADDFPNNVFTLLGGDYSLNVEEPATQLCPEGLCGERAREPLTERLRDLAVDLGIVSLHQLLPEGLRSDLPAVDRTFGDFEAGGDEAASAASPESAPDPSAVLNRRQAFERFLGEVRPARARPSMHFAHVVLPHVPWQYLPTGQQYPPDEPDIPGLNDEVWASDPLLVRLGLQRHLLQTGYVDRVIGRLMARLRRAGIADRALLVVTADHGVSFRPGKPRRSPSPETLSDVAAVPLFIKYPGQRRGRIDDSFVRTIDVVPTIADQLGVEMPWAADGRSIKGGGPSRGVVAVAAGRNPGARAPFSDFVRQRQAGLRRLIRMFGSGDRGTGLYAIGPNRDLLGRAAAKLVVARGVPARVDLSSTQLLGRLRPGARIIPSRITGRIFGDLAPGTPLAVVVGGRVRGLTESFEHEGDVRLAAMVPPAAFGSGSKRIEVFTVEGTGNARRLVRLQVERAKTYRFVERDGNTLIAGEGRELPVVPGAVAGSVDDLKADGPVIRVGGWAAHRGDRRPARRILVFAGERLVAQGRPDIPRDDIVRQLGAPAVSKSGYGFRVGSAGAKLSDIRVFAIYRNGASELPRYSGR